MTDVKLLAVEGYQRSETDRTSSLRTIGKDTAPNTYSDPPFLFTHPFLCTLGHISVGASSGAIFI